MSVEDRRRRQDVSAVTYAVGREKIREYARAVGEDAADIFDLERACAAGHEDLDASLFATVYTAEAISAALVDPELEIDFPHLLHAAQEFARPAGRGRRRDHDRDRGQGVSERGGMAFYVFETRSTNQRGERVCTGTWNNAVREA